ncbi:MAG: urease accessory protein UreD [Candidatus Accumulibacter necessarius]
MRTAARAEGAVPGRSAVCHAIVLHPPGGIAGGDRLEISVAAAPAHALLTTPGAGKWYRSGGRQAQQSLTVRVAREAVVEWLPQETIVFDGAEATMHSRIELAAGGVFCGWEILCLGRTAAGERFSYGRPGPGDADREGRAAVVARTRSALRRLALARSGRRSGRPAGECDAAARRPDGRARVARGLRALPVADGLLTGVTALPELLVARCLAPGAEVWHAPGWATCGSCCARRRSAGKPCRRASGVPECGNA